MIAAELTLLRSRLLVPANPAEAQAARDDAEHLRRSLLGRMEMARAADWLEGRMQVGRDVFLRGQTDAGSADRPERTGDIAALLRACLAAIRLPAEAGALYRGPGPPVWSVLDAVARIRTMLPGLEEEGGSLSTFLPPIPADAPEREGRYRITVSATFLAGLELARDGAAELMQVEAWETIQISCLPIGDLRQAAPYE